MYPAWANADLHLTSTGMKIILVIPKINTEVIYTGKSITIKLPKKLFDGKTEGQCGEFLDFSNELLGLKYYSKLS